MFLLFHAMFTNGLGIILLYGEFHTRQTGTHLYLSFNQLYFCCFAHISLMAVISWKCYFFLMKTGEKWMLNFFQHFQILKELKCFLHHLIFAVSSTEIMEGGFLSHHFWWTHKMVCTFWIAIAFDCFWPCMYVNICA